MAFDRWIEGHLAAWLEFYICLIEGKWLDKDMDPLKVRERKKSLELNSRDT